MLLFQFFLSVVIFIIIIEIRKSILNNSRRAVKSSKK